MESTTTEFAPALQPARAWACHFSTLAEFIAILLLAALPTARAWFPGRYFVPADFVQQLQPWQPAASAIDPTDPRFASLQGVILTQSAVERLRAHEIPLWDSHIQMGVPFIGIGKSAVFFPTTFLHLLFRPRYAWLLAAWLKFAAAGIGAWLLARRYLLSSSARLLTAASFMFCGLLLLAPHDACANVTAMLPWALLVIDRILERATAGRIAIAAISVGIAFLGGDPPAIAGMLLTILSFLICSATSQQKAMRLPAAIAGVAIGAALAGVQLAPLGEYLLKLPSISQAGSIPLRQLSLLTTLTHVTWTTAPMLGAIASLLAVAGIIFCGRDRRSQFWLAMAILSVALSIIFVWVICQWADPSIAITLAGPGLIAGPLLAAAMLAGLGLDGISQSPRTFFPAPLVRRGRAGVGADHPLANIDAPSASQHSQPPPQSSPGVPGEEAKTGRSKLLFILASFTTLILLAGFWQRASHPWLLQLAIRATTVTIAFAALTFFSHARRTWPLFLLATVELLAFAIPYGAASKSPVIDAIPHSSLASLLNEPGIGYTWGQSKMLPSPLASALSLQDIRAAGLLPQSTAENLASHDAAPSPSPRIFHLFNIRYWMAEPDAAPPANFWRKAGISDDRMALFEPVNAGTPVWVTKSATLLSHRDDVLDRIIQPSFDPAGPVILDPTIDNPFDDSLDNTGNTPWYQHTSSRWGADEAHLLLDDPEQIEVGINYHGGGWLVLAERFYPGWQARVRVERMFRRGPANQSPEMDVVAPIVRAFGCLRAIWIPSRAVSVTFVYDPQSWRIGYFGSIAGLLAIILLFGLTLLARSTDGTVFDE